ncbi:hypothetical protein AL546_009050 [Vibrio vulnificus]|uniref:hypothetical protein n=1 Tax=Vibrio vulnificus TaxID=672 RepID=UPI00073599A5|nr:hypothetical protein [Vibrio vulnificus]EIX4876220.1 hypothetical protein [Vibrio vulnificus]PNM58795.1 hypothetical protein AL546_009050 [Vibrio vulnificus]SUP14206.1 Uncharacterised protein [Vibrio vulnificus]HAS8111393.1 hypothetical protein [Vibrio vulnificus]HAS8160648.1 hypothetical protein [Vibrio vulnificus]
MKRVQFNLLLLIIFVPIGIMLLLGKLIFNKVLGLDWSDEMACVGAFLILSLVSVVSVATTEPLDLKLLSRNKDKLFSIIYFDGTGTFTYCKDRSDLVRVEFFDDVKKPYIIFTCKSVDHHYKLTREKVRYYKYHRLDANRKISLCGWRDNTIKLNSNGGVQSVNTEKSNSSECPNFDIDKYSDT